MTFVLFIIYTFLSLLNWILFIDIVLSWGTLLGIRFRPRFIASIMDPLYTLVKRHIPTTLGMIDFSAVIILVVLNLLASLLVQLDPRILHMIP